MTSQEFLVLLIGLGLIGSLLAVIYFVKRKQSRNRQESFRPKKAFKTIDSRPQGEPAEALDLDARRIHDYMVSLPPYQLEEAAKKYTGKRIRWEVNFEYINSRQASVVNAMCYYKGDYPWIYFSADVNEFPVLQQLNSREKMILTGTIEKYDLGDGGFHIIPEDIKPA